MEGEETSGEQVSVSYTDRHRKHQTYGLSWPNETS